MRQRPELGDAEPVFLVDTGNDETTYTDRDVQPGVLYVYTIHAANFFNGISQASLTAQVRTPIGETPENSPATGQPTITGTAQVGQTLTAGTVGIADEDGLEKVSYSYQWLADASDITDATGDTYTLLAADEGKTVKVKVTFTDDADNEETLTSTATDPVAPLPNNPATGAPIITGTVQVGETLTVDITGIEDPDGMDGVQFSYQWISNDRTSDSDITDATGDTYTLLDVDEGKTIKVTLSFTDDAGNEETLTSAATSTVAAAPIPLTASVHDAPESHDGENAFTFELRLSEEPVSTFSYGTLRDHAFTVTGGEVTKAGRLGAPGNVRWEITMTPDGDGNVTVVLPVTQDCAEEGAICTGDGRMLSAEVTLVVTGPGDEEEQNSPATGQPAIGGTLQVGETLTADTSGIADDDGLDNATFSYQWLADDVDISGATGDRYTLTDSEEGKAVKVRVSFTDDAGNEETLTSDATSTVAAAPIPLTASVHDAPESHDGENAFTFELRLSEEPVSTFSYGTLRDHAFTVTGGEVTEAGRLGAPGNVRWEITMTPDGDGNVTVVLPVTQDCAEEGAICTGDGRMLSAEVTLVVTGPGDEEEQNSPATGQPAISGTLQVGETLTADTSGIADDDGLDNATFSYQWLADDVDISGATGDRYTLTDSEEGKAVKVRVSFTDDAGNEETLTSAATSTVAGRPLSLDDFDAGDGQTVLASALVRVGNRGRKSNGNQDRAWYASATSAWHASGKLRDGSLAWNGMTLNRVLYFSDTGSFRFNEADDVHIGESFAAGGVNRELTVWVQTETEAVSFLAKDNIRKSGSGYISFETPTGIRSVLGGVSEGALIIIAVSAPTDS